MYILFAAERQGPARVFAAASRRCRQVFHLCAYSSYLLPLSTLLVTLLLAMVDSAQPAGANNVKGSFLRLLTVIFPPFPAEGPLQTAGNPTPGNVAGGATTEAFCHLRPAHCHSWWRYVPSRLLT